MQNHNLEKSKTSIYLHPASRRDLEQAAERTGRTLSGYVEVAVRDRVDADFPHGRPWLDETETVDGVV